MRKHTWIIPVTSLMLLAGCSTSATKELTKPINIQHASKQVDNVLVNANAQAASLVFKKDENVIFSPLSYHFALGMLEEGLSGDSLEEIQAYFGTDQATSANRLLMAQDLYDNKETITLSNSLWVQEGSEVNKDTLQQISDLYRASTFQLSLPEDAKKITEFIKEQTDGKIEPEIEATKDTVLMLVNTLAIEDEWMSEFAVEENQIFHHGTEDITTNFLSGIMDSPDYAEINGYQVIDLYMKEGSRLRIALPKESSALSHLSTEELQALMDATLEPQELTRVALKFPSFTIHQHHDLLEMTQNLGMKGMFTNTQDLTKFGDQLAVSSIIQDAMIEVTQYGLSAAASTVVGVSKMSLPPEDLEWKEIEMTADHAFLYFVMDEQDHVMFAGKVVNPTAK